MSSTLSPPGDRPGSGPRLEIRAAVGNARIPARISARMRARVWAPRLLFSLAAAYAAMGLAIGWWPLGR